MTPRRIRPRQRLAVMTAKWAFAQVSLAQVQRQARDDQSHAHHNSARQAQRKGITQ